MDVLCVGSAVVDIMAMAIPPREIWKEKQRIDRIKFLVGGDAANQSVHLSDAKLETYLCASLGNDNNGEMLLRLLEKRGVHTDLVAKRPYIATGTSMVLVDAEGNRNTFSVKGAHSALSKEDLPKLSEMNADQLPKAISLASLFSMPVLEEDGLLEFLKEAKTLGIPVFADLGSDKKQQGLPGIQEFIPYITYFLPSLYDILELTGKETAEEAAEVLRACGAANVIIKCGADGCFYTTGSESGWVPALRVRPIDTTGAGDCMVAMFISRIIRGDDMESALRYANTMASLSTMYEGASEKNLLDSGADQI